MPSIKKVDVLINVFGKPYQTALSLLTLLHHSGEKIDAIYFHEEPCTSVYERKGQEVLLEYLGSKIRHFFVPYWLASNTTDEERLKTDEQYRLSMRYQYGWEQSDKDFVLLIHNDIEVTNDVIGAMHARISDATAIGEIGQCWWCPAAQHGACSSERYTEFIPKYHQLMYLYNEGMSYTERRAYNLGLRQEFWEKPWPLPECRVNEWCMLVNLQKSRPVTFPFGSAHPIGSFIDSGARIGKGWDEKVNLDTGVQWFRDMNHLGYTFKDFPIEEYIIHDRRGRVATIGPELYVKNEIFAKKRLQELFPDFYKLL